MPNNVSDGHHTFAELYEHRYWLWIKYCELFDVSGDERVWRSKLHSDGTMFDDSFIMGIGRELGEQVTYHLPLRLWDETDFAETLDRAPEYDGHTSADALERLKQL